VQILINFIELYVDPFVDNKIAETGQHGSREHNERGVDMNAQDASQLTPSRFPSNFGLVELVQVLLDHGANVNAWRNGGEALSNQESEGEYHI
jgi:hypothetical protein